MKELFRKSARWASAVFGSTWAFIIALAAIVVWAVTGPYFEYSNAWQLIINTGTTIITFLMVFLIQNTQNRDTLAIHLKLDELIRSIKRADNNMIDLDVLTDEQMRHLHERYLELCAGSSPGKKTPPPPEARRSGT